MSPRPIRSSTPRLLPRTVASVLWLPLACSPSLVAQQLIGYVPTHDATVIGSKDEVDGQAVLAGSVSVTAKDHTAPITLGRGGTVRVCQTSVLHVTENKAVTVAAPLLFSLDRGAIEISTIGTPSDSIMTPDLRFTVRNSGPLDLRMRVASNGDTCVENRGAAAPTLAVSDPFGESMYELAPGQHVLFEHGSLHDVVDHETIPCGCPDRKGESVADALLTAKRTGGKGPATDKSAPVVTPAQVEAEHPFPQALSEGLAPGQEAPAAATTQPGQVSQGLSYSAVMQDPDALDSNKPTPQTQAAAFSQPEPPDVGPPAPKTPPQPAAQVAQVVQPAKAPPAASAPAPPEKSNDLVHVMGRFFRKVFTGK